MTPKQVSDTYNNLGSQEAILICAKSQASCSFLTFPILAESMIYRRLVKKKMGQAFSNKKQKQKAEGLFTQQSNFVKVNYLNNTVTRIFMFCFAGSRTRFSHVRSTCCTKKRDTSFTQATWADTIYLGQCNNDI